MPICKPHGLLISARIFILFVCLSIPSFFNAASAQKAVGIGTTEPNQHAILHLVSPENNQGLLLPQITTTQRFNINASSPEDDGLIIFDITEKTFYYWKDNNWQAGLGNSTAILDLNYDATTQTLSSGNSSVILSQLLQTAQTVEILSISGLSATNVQGALQEIHNNLSLVNDNQNLTLTGTNLSIENGNSIDLSGLQDGFEANTDAQNLTFSGTSLSIDNGNSVDLSSIDTQLSDADITNLGYIKSADDADADPTNEIQDLSLSGNILSLSGSAASVNLSAFSGTNTDEQTIDEFQRSGTELRLSLDNDGQPAQVVDLAPIIPADVSDLTDNTNIIFNREYSDLNNVPTNLSDFTNDLGLGVDTDDQNLGFDGTNLTITDGTGVDVSNWDLDASDDFDGDYNNLSNLPTLFTGDYNDLSNLPSLFSGNWSDLAGIPVDLSDGDDVNDADADSSNELQDLSLSGNILSLSGSAATVNLSAFSGTNTDEQNLTLSGTDLTIDNGNTVSLATIDTQLSDADITALGYIKSADDADPDATNELQTLSLAGSDLTLSNGGGTITLPGGFSGDFGDLANIPAGLADGDDFEANTDNQTLSVSGSNLIISGGNTVPLSSIQDGTGTDDQVAAEVNVADAGGNFTNTDVEGVLTEIDTRIDALVLAGGSDGNDFVTGGTLTGTDLTLSVPNQINPVIDLSSLNVDDADADATNELQTLSLVGSDLTLSNGGGTVTIPGGFSGDFGDLINVPADLSDGDDVNDADADPTNEIELPTQTGADAGRFLQADGAGNVAYIDAPTGSDDQMLSFAAGAINLEDGGSVDVSNWDLDASDDFDGDYNNLINLPTLFSGDYNDLGNLPTLFSGNWSDLAGIPVGILDGDDVNDADADPTNEIELPTQTGADAGRFLQADGAGNVVYTNAPTVSDDQTIDQFDLSSNSLRLSLENDGQPLSTVDFSALTLSGEVVGTLNTTTIAANIIDGDNIIDNSLDGDDIANNSITNLELADNSVTTIKINNNAVSAVKIQGNAGGGDQVLYSNNAGTVSWVDYNTIESGLTLSGDVSGPLSNTIIGNNTVGSDQITNNSITTDDIANSAVNSDEIANGAVTDAKIAALSPSKLLQAGASNGQVLKWDGSNWAAADDEIGSGGVPGTITSYYSIDPSAFTAAYANNQDPSKNNLVLFENGGNEIVSIYNRDEGQTITAPIQLPHNAEVQGITVYFLDSRGPAIDFDFVRKQFGSGTSNLTSASTSGSSGAARNISLGGTFTIDNENYTYSIRATFDMSGDDVENPGDIEHGVFGVRIRYTEPGNLVSGPGVNQTAFVSNDPPPAGDRYVGLLWVETDQDLIRVWTGSGWNTVANND